MLIVSNYPSPFVKRKTPPCSGDRAGFCVLQICLPIRAPWRTGRDTVFLRAVIGQFLGVDAFVGNCESRDDGRNHQGGDNYEPNHRNVG